MQLRMVLVRMVESMRLKCRLRVPSSLDVPWHFDENREARGSVKEIEGLMDGRL